MVIWLYILIVVLALLTLPLLLRLRIRVVLDDRQRIVFLGLGQSGPEIDFRTKRGTLKIAGVAVREFPLERKKKPDSKKNSAKAEKPRRGIREFLLESPAKAWAEARQFGSLWWRDIRGKGDRITRAVVSFGTELIRDLTLEQFEADIEAGFDEPHLTGEAYGYYQAVAAAIPMIGGHVRFTPVWTEASFRGAVRLSIALPLYALVWRTLRLLWRLPITKIVSAVIQKKKGDRDV
ncbi:hypothetical protein KQH82_09115 [bacterium]|nr:hypothetical protein [bacterium]